MMPVPSTFRSLRPPPARTHDRLPLSFFVERRRSLCPPLVFAEYRTSPYRTVPCVPCCIVPHVRRIDAPTKQRLFSSAWNRTNFICIGVLAVPPSNRSLFLTLPEQKSHNNLDLRLLLVTKVPPETAAPALSVSVSRLWASLR